ncbi:MAG TPA: iron-containing alcohol dehydrogenase family protein [Dissulfurispiraceae bacterium]|nr:iron-containing alcohol dehydrogenase family protein [Dissulfurispiraceae bacterium]
MNFTFHLPAKIFFGLECVAKNSAEFALWGKHALIVTGRSSAIASGALADVLAALGSHGMTWEIFDRIEENPSFATVEAGGAAARCYKADMIIGIGGGSPLDAAKAIAVLAGNRISARQLFDGNFPAPPLPIIAVPLTAGTGSEVTQYSILTDAERRTKRSFADRGVFPKAAFLDARYTQSLSRTVTINTAIDALSHAVEGYLSKRSNFMSDQLALNAICHFGKMIGALGRDILSIDERERLLYVSLLGGMVIAQTGTTMVHSLGYSLTYFRNIPHGRANGLLLAEALRYAEKTVPGKIAAILEALGLHSIDELKDTMLLLLGPEEPWTAEELETFSSIALQAANIANTPKVPDQGDLKRVLINSAMMR